MIDTTRHTTIINNVEWEKLGNIHIIGCGATGSNLAYMLAKLGITNNIYLYDFDIVEKHNLSNQYFNNENLGKNKAQELKQNMLVINKDMNIKAYNEKVMSLENMSGLIFCLVDTMKSRKELFNSIKDNQELIFVDTRLGIYEFYYYIVNSSNKYHKYKYSKSLSFTDNEKNVSLCGGKITLLPTINMGVSSLLLEINKLVKKETISNSVKLYATTLQTIKGEW